LSGSSAGSDDLWAAIVDELRPVLAAARDVGFLGPGPVERHVEVAAALAAAWAIAGSSTRGEVAGEPGQALDLGSGAGLPGLALALRWPTTRWVLLDAHARRCRFASDAAGALGLADRVEVRQARAEVAGRNTDDRGQYALVTARGFGPPAVSAECGAPFLQLGGLLVVSDVRPSSVPPALPSVAAPADTGPAAEPERWPPTELSRLGLVVDIRSDPAATIAWTALRQQRRCPDQFPRRVGLPAKRPLW
jgi:16S rRNA (guanine527-N7)-methyltransferase